MAQEGVGAALTIPDDIMGQLERAQKLVTQMSDSAEKMGAGFQAAAASIKTAMDSIGEKGAATFKTDGVVSNLELIVGTVKKLDQTQSIAEKSANALAAALRKNDGTTIKSLEAKSRAISEALAKPGLNAEQLEKGRMELVRVNAELDRMKSSGVSAVDSVTKRLSSLGVSGNLDKMRERLEALKASLRELKALSRQGIAIPAGTIEATTKAIGALKERISATNTLMGVTAKNAMMVKGMLSAAFSPIMIASFLKNMVAVRGEFEIAQKSLAVLIKDESMAADMFEEISRIAIKSPFSVMEMTKQVKQLAAYRIENEKLIETTKMLGDISAGVGVDMNRLILAYGQVRAATYLKGQELRQFSEAGVNMLGGLAERFSQIYQRAVSTGEVLQMVSKRMVSFEDVDAVLRQQTSLGGTFYQMQEKQAETLKGMIVNLQDRIQLMFNKTGGSFDSLMKSIVKGIEWVLSHADLLSGVLMPLVTMKVTSGVLGLLLDGNTAKTIGNITRAARAASAEMSAMASFGLRVSTTMLGGLKAFSSALGKIGWAGVISAVLAVAAAIAMWVRHLTAFKREISGIFEKASASATESVASYNKLVDTATDLSRTEKERVKAIEDLKREYGNILPIQDIELSNVDKLNAARSQHIQLIRQQIQEEAKANAMRAAINRANEDSAKRTKALMKGMSFFGGQNAGYGQKYSGSENEGFGFIQKYKDEVAGLSELTKDEVESIRQDVEDKIFGGLIDDANKARDEFLRGVLVRSWATADQISKIIGNLTSGDFAEITKVFDPIIRDLNLINQIGAEKGPNVTIPRGLEKYKDAIDSITDSRKKFLDTLTEEQKATYRANPPKLEVDAKEFIREQKAQILAAINDEDYGEIGEEQKKMLVSALDDAFSKASDTSSIEDWFNAQVSAVNDAFPNLVKKMGVGELAKKASDSFGDYAKVVNKELKEVESTMKRLNDPRLSEGQLLEIAREWGGETYQAYEKANVAVRDFKVELDALPGKIAEAQKSGNTQRWTELQARQRDVQVSYNEAVVAGAEAQANLSKASLENLTAEASAMKMLIDYLGLINDKKAEAQAAATYRSNLKSFVSEVKNAASEFDKLDAQGDQLLRDKLAASAKKLNVKLPESFSDEDIDKWFATIEKKLPKEEVIEMKLSFNKNETAKRIKEMSDEASSLWDKYDNAKKLEDWGLDFVGQSSSSILSDLRDIEKRLRDENTKDSIAAADQIKEKRLQIARSEQEEAAKIMYEAQKKALTKTEQAYATMFENIAKIRSDANKGENKFSPEQIDAAVQAQVAKSMKEVADAEWDAYKSTEMYASAFGNLDNVSKDVLVTLRRQLEDFRDAGGLNPTEIVAIEKALKKINTQVASMDSGNGIFGPIGEWGNAIRENRKLFEPRGAATLAQNEYLADAANLAYWEAEVRQRREAIATAEDQAQAENDLTIAEYMLEAARDKASSSFRTYNGLLEEGAGKLEEARKKATMVSDAYNKVGSEIGAIVGLVKDVADAFGGELSDEAEAALDGIQSGFALVGTTISVVNGAMEVWDFLNKKLVAGGATILATYWPLLVIGGVLAATVAIIKAKDAALTKQVEEHKKAVEDLKTKYEELERSMNRAMSLQNAAAFNKQMMSNLEQQKRNLQDALAIEESRNNQTDKVKESIKSLNEEIANTSNAIQDAKDDWIEFMGGFADSREEARSWASSWLDAFKNAESGVSALGKSFDEMYDDLVAAQLSDILMPQMEELKQLIFGAVSNGVIDQAEAAAIQAQKAALQGLDAELKNRARELGVGVSGESQTNTLRKGVESVTEQTAQALESILNSTRYYVADNNRILLSWDEQMMNPENENSILSNIRSQTRYLRVLSQIANAVYSPGSSGQGAGGIKVFVMG